MKKDGIHGCGDSWIINVIVLRRPNWKFQKRASASAGGIDEMVLIRNWEHYVTETRIANLIPAQGLAATITEYEA